MRCRRSVSLSLYRENRNTTFYALMLRSKGEKGLAIYGFPGGKIRRQGIYTFPPENGVLLHSKPISAPIRKPGHGGYLIATSSYSFSWITFIKCNNRGIIKHFFISFNSSVFNSISISSVLSPFSTYSSKFSSRVI